jgi:hypothetical protein
MGEKAMKPRIEIDRATNVAYFDVCDPAEEPADSDIRVFSVSDKLGLHSQVLARVDVSRGVFLGMIIQDYKSFSREIRRKYLAWRIERLVELILCTVKSIVSNENPTEHRGLAAAAR